MHASFRPSHRSGYGADSTTVSTGSGTVKRGVNISDAKFEDLVSGVTSVLTTGITTAGDVAQTRITQKAAKSGSTLPTSSGTPKFVSKDTSDGGESGISGTTLVLGAAALAVVGFVGYKLLQKK